MKDVKVYRPGDAEFDEIAATATPQHKLKGNKDNSLKTYISAEQGPRKSIRNESVDKLCGF